MPVADADAFLGVRQSWDDRGGTEDDGHFEFVGERAKAETTVRDFLHGTATFAVEEAGSCRSMTRTAREFNGEPRSVRFFGLLVATALFGTVALLLWRKASEEPELRFLAIMFTIGSTVSLAALLVAARNMRTSVVRILMVPSLPTLGEPVEFHWSLPEGAAPLKTLEITLEEFKREERSSGESGSHIVRRLIKRHSVVRVHGEDTIAGDAEYELPDRNNLRLKDRETRIFELVVRGRSHSGAGPHDRYSLGEFAFLD